jgi:ComF family protein
LNILLPLQACFRRLFHHFLPTSCLLCGCHLGTELLCDACELSLPHSEHQDACQQCALPLATYADFCGQCLQKPPAFSRSVIPFIYQHPVDFLIHNFKYRRKLSHGRALAQLLAHKIRHDQQEHPDNRPDLLLTVPLHWSRRWQRGFNQTEIIAKELAVQLQIPLLTHTCRRRTATPSQKGLSRAQRQSNLRGAFELTKNSQKLIEGKRVALLDDVVTTTATARELSKLLIKHGATDVQIWALARTPNHD